MSLELIGKYIGSNEIVSTKVLDLTTPAGTQIIEVEFKKGNKRMYNVETLKTIITDEISDESTVSQKKLMPVVQKMMELVAEHDLQYGEVDMLTKQFITNIENTFNRALSFLWFKTDKEFIPGTDPMWDVSVLHAHDVFTQIRKENE